MRIKCTMMSVGIGFWLVGMATLAGAGPLDQSVRNGQKLFTTAHFNGNGRTCNSCHRGEGRTAGMLPDGSRIPSLGNAAAIFPRYSKGAKAVITLPQQVHRCVAGALQGTPPAYDSAEMTDLISYLTSLSEGKAVKMGGAPQ